ncbi:MAG: sulfur carrier protein ThiS [Bdellovibrionota bacterium]
MQLTVNGEKQQVPDGLSVGGLLAHLSVDREKVAVEVDRQVVPKAQYEEKKLSSGAQVEIVQFVGGG